MKEDKFIYPSKNFIIKAKFSIRQENKIQVEIINERRARILRSLLISLIDKRYNEEKSFIFILYFFMNLKFLVIYFYALSGEYSVICEKDNKQPIVFLPKRWPSAAKTGADV